MIDQEFIKKSSTLLMKSPSPATLLVRKSSPPPMIKVPDDELVTHIPSASIPPKDLYLNDIMWRQFKIGTPSGIPAF